MGVRFRVLGPLEATVDGTPLPIPSGRLTTLLAGLLLRANRTVPIDLLNRWLWDGDEPDPRRAKATIQEYIRRLRRILGSDGLIRTAPGGYLINADDDTLDLLRFRTLAARGRSAAEAGESSAAAERLTAALDLWRGPALLNTHSRALHDDELINLAEERLVVSERWAETMLEIGEHERVIPKLRVLITEHPLRERLWEHLILALYRDHRPADALTAFGDVRGILSDQLGVDPGVTLRQLHLAVLTNDPSLDLQPHPPRPVATPAIPRQLPADISHFTGRTKDMRLLARLVSAHGEHSAAIAAIEGTAGVGKTTIAVHFAHQVAARFADGQVFLNLHGYGPGEPLSPAAALAMMLTALGTPADQLPGNVDERSSLWRSLTANRRMIVVLDNARDTEHVRPLLPGAGCLALLTSRTQLRGLVAREGAMRVALDRLEPDEALALLTSIIGAERTESDLAAARRIVEVCARLPLAMRIIGERISRQPTDGLAEVVDKLDARSHRLPMFDLDDDLDTNLSMVFSRSYQALDDDAARLFRLLGTQPATDFTAPAAAAVAALPEQRAQILLDRLTGAHLLEEHRAERYQFHDLMREFALLTSQDNDDDQAVRNATSRLLSWYIHTALNANDTMAPYRGRDLVGNPPPDVHPLEFNDLSQGLSWCDSEWPNLVALGHEAWRQRLFWHASRLPWALAHFFQLRIHADERMAMHSMALSAARELGDHSAEAHILNGLGVASSQLSQHGAAVDYFLQALKIWQEAGDGVGKAMMLNNLANAHERNHEYDKAVLYGDKAVQAARDIESRPREAISLHVLALGYIGVARTEDAVACAQRSHSMLKELGVPMAEVAALRVLGMAYASAGNHALAMENYNLAVAQAQELDLRYDESQSLIELGEAHAQHGDLVEARECWQRALTILVKLRHPLVDSVLDRLAESHPHPQSG